MKAVEHLFVYIFFTLVGVPLIDYIRVVFFKQPF